MWLNQKLRRYKEEWDRDWCTIKFHGIKFFLSCFTSLPGIELQTEQHAMHCSYSHFSQHLFPSIFAEGPAISMKNVMRENSKTFFRDLHKKKWTSKRAFLVLGSSMVGKYWRALIALTCTNHRYIRIQDTFNWATKIHQSCVKPLYRLISNKMFKSRGMEKDVTKKNTAMLNKTK